MKRILLALFAVALVAAPVAGSAQSRECGTQKAKECNPQQECLRQVERRLKGDALQRARNDCRRMPTSGNCYGGEIQSDCQEPRRRR
ncbi:MAG TPA: hypothetical protein VMR23_04965 [Candidatus Limnocylindria bacterium]|nr:hypothetical protein [Candidatus Limnocylindria bacterium]